jgi:3-oxoacyl-[acyl-carrier protein] reductase
VDATLTMTILDGKAALVTGAGRGIGRATAALLAEHGARVLVNDLDPDLAEEAARELGGEAVAFGGDVTASGVPEALIDRVVEAFGGLDILVNNAGYTWDGVVHRMSDEQFRAMLEIHTVAPFRIIRAAAPHMRDVAKQEREEGRTVFRKIVNVSSISGTMGNAGQANYASGKAGLVGLTKSLAKEWGQFSINVNAVAFGFVETRLTAVRGEAGTFEQAGVEIELGIPAQFRELAASTIPLGRPAQPEEAAGAIFFLCSPWSNYVHGQVLNVTGGQIAGMGS